MRASDWVTNHLYLDGKPFSLLHYPFYRDIYDQEHDSMLLMTGRQVAKSTALANLIIKNTCLRDYWKSLFIAPSQEQTTRFSQTRYGQVLMHSPRLRPRWVTSDLASRVFLKQMKNGSLVTLSYACDNADRVRGISADEVDYDEIQDIEYEAVVPVISEVLANSDFRRENFCGTPKTMENTIERIWQWSTQSEWCIRCDSCGKFTPGFRDDRVLGKRGPICVSCGSYLNVRNGVWVDMRRYTDDYDGKRVKGFHISQLMLPRNVPSSMPSDASSQELALKRWKKILEKYTTYPTSRFKNEVLGVSDSTGSRLLTMEELRSFCTDYVISDFPQTGLHYDGIVAGIDWSGGGAMGQSYTVLWIWGIERSIDMHNMRLHTLYAKIYSGNNPISGDIVTDIVRKCSQYRVDLILGDAGGGALANDYMRSAFGAKARQVQYRSVSSSSSGRPPFYWNKLDRYMAERTTMIDHYLVYVKNGGARFANFAQMEESFKHVLSVYEEESQTGQKVWRRTAGEPDDALHAQVFGWIAANVLIGNGAFTKEVL